MFSKIFKNYLNEKFIINTTYILCVIFIFIDFLRIALANMYKIYNITVPIIAIIIIIVTLLNFGKIDNFKKNIVYFVIYISFVEMIHSNFDNIVVISENICWTMIPLNIIHYMKSKRINTILLLYLTLNALLSIPSVLNHYIDLPVLTEPGVIGVADAGFYGQRNINGMINAIACMITLFLLDKTEHKSIKLYLLMLQFFSFVNVIFSGSRSSLVALILSVGLFFILKIKKIKYIIYSGIGLFLLIIITVFNRIKSQLKLGLSTMRILDIITTYRNRVWAESIYLVNKLNILIGCGVNTLYDNSVKYLGESSNIVEQGPYINNCHNLFVNILYFSGIIALILFFIIVIKYFKKITINITKGNSIRAFCVVLCGFIISMLDVPLLYTTSFINIIWWLFVFYTVSEA